MKLQLQDKPTIQSLLFNHWFNNLWQRSFGKDFADNGTSREYLLADALGSTRNLTDSTGSVVKSLEYDVFGSIRTQSGTASTGFKFTGEQTDDESGLIFLRARYYDPEIGRFISKDPHPGYADISQSLNRYIYVQNNPINFIDPSGLDKEEAKQYIARTPAEQLQASLVKAAKGKVKVAKERLKEAKEKLFKKSEEEKLEMIEIGIKVINIWLYLYFFPYIDPFDSPLPPSVHPLFPTIRKDQIKQL